MSDHIGDRASVKQRVSQLAPKDSRTGTTITQAGKATTVQRPEISTRREERRSCTIDGRNKPYVIITNIQTSQEIMNNNTHNQQNNVSTMLSDSLENYLTIGGLCDSIKNNCGEIATKTDVENAVDTLVSESTLNNYYTKSETYSQSEINTKFENYYTKTKINDTLANYAVISKEQALTIKSITQADSTKLLNDTTLTIPTGFTLDADHLVKLYINGVYVGDNTDGVLVVTDKKVKYVPAENGDYKLVVGDRIKIIYWVKKN